MDVTVPIRIKRRANGGGAGAPNSLMNGELAYNEQTNICYYGYGVGGANGTATQAIPIAGSGAFATRDYVTAAVAGVDVSAQLASFARLSGASFTGDVTVGGNLVVQGTTTTINSTTVTVADKNLELGTTASPTDATADGGGIALRGTTTKSLQWSQAAGAWVSSEHVSVATGKQYYVGSNAVLSGTSLGSTIVGSSLTQVGTIATGVWQGTAVGVPYGGTGLTSAAKGSVLVANADNALTALDGGGVRDGVLAYSASTDTVAWSPTIDGGVF